VDPSDEDPGDLPIIVIEVDEKTDFREQLMDRLEALVKRIQTPPN
jgi:benzoyl-CoA reductase/2-hydroxyglutaryl-CoA dehydratase subunit BcrC/BadD/HgdB